MEVERRGWGWRRPTRVGPEPTKDFEESLSNSFGKWKNEVTNWYTKDFLSLSIGSQTRLPSRSWKGSIYYGALSAGMLDVVCIQIGWGRGFSAIMENMQTKFGSIGPLAQVLQLDLGGGCIPKSVHLWLY